MTIEFDGQNNKLGTTTANSVTIKTNDTDAITVDSSQNVGVGTSSPNDKLDVEGTGNVRVRVTSTDNTQANINFRDSSNSYCIGIEGGTNALRFASGVSLTSDERMRIDSSGNVLVGQSTTAGPGVGNTTAGHAFQSNGRAVHSYGAGATAGFFNHNSDGKLVNFYKSGVENGSIGTFGSEIIMGTGICGIRYNGDKVTPFSITSYGNTDNTLDLGHPSIRWQDIYATNGTIQTSDQNEKQSIESLTASEMAVAQRISKLFKTFKWNSAVEEKGDNARTHTGIIAQDVQQAFADEGLDANNYGLFCSDTWWEKEISVDAVAEELDEEGNVLVEGKDSYTYIDTKEEATEGYTERTRLGIRYPELLSFVSSAFEQRLTNIETRLEALENE